MTEAAPHYGPERLTQGETSGAIMPSGRRGTRFRSRAGSIIAILLLALCVLATGANLLAGVGAVARIAHNRAVLATAEGMLSAMKDLETGERGYLLPGADQYLEPYDDGRSASASSVPASYPFCSSSLTSN